jgi:hypothetical protein
MPQTGELAEQNIRDRYYGINDPVAKKMLRRLGERVKLDPPEDMSICTLYVGNIEPNWREGDLRSDFDKHGQVTTIRMVHNKSCAFVTYSTREVCAEDCKDEAKADTIRFYCLCFQAAYAIQPNSSAPAAWVWRRQAGVFHSGSLMHIICTGKPGVLWALVSSVACRM